MMKILVTILLFFTLNIGYSQTTPEKIDSLKNALMLSKLDTNRVKIMLNLSEIYFKSNIDSSVFYGQNALFFSRQISFARGEAQALGDLIWAFRISGNTEKALELTIKQLKISDKNHLMDFKAKALFAIGWSYFHDLNDYSKGLNYMLEAKALLNQLNDKVQLVETEGMIGDNFTRHNQFDSAEHYIHLSMLHDSLFNTDFKYVALGMMGKLYGAKGDIKKGIEFSKQGLKRSNSIPDYFTSSWINIQIGKMYQQINQKDSAIFFATNALNNAKTMNSFNKIIESSALLHDLYKNNNTDKALYYNEITLNANDSLNKIRKSFALKNVLDFDAQERQYEIETTQKEYRNSIKQYVLLAGLGIFSLIGFILYRNNQKEKKAKKLLQEQKEKVESTLTQLQATQAQLIQSEKLASLGELTAGIAHEIQNPLNFVNNFSELSVDLAKDLNDEIHKPDIDKEYIEELLMDLTSNQEKINHHGKRASSIVKGMLEHSRASTGVKELTDINKLADEYLRLSYHGLRAKDKDFNATMETHFQDPLSKIEVIPQDMGRVLLNLFNNAFYAGLQKAKLDINSQYEPKITVTTEQLDHQILIKVMDNGTGMPESVRAKVFQPFFTTKPTGQGTGLGLSLAYDIVTKGHGGALEVESTEGVGTTFFIKLPI